LPLVARSTQQAAAHSPPPPHHTPTPRHPRLHNTLNALQEEARVPLSGPSGGPQAADGGASDNLARGLLGSYAVDAEPQQYRESFEALLRFVDASLDLYKV